MGEWREWRYIVPQFLTWFQIEVNGKLQAPAVQEAAEESSVLFGS